MKHLSCFQKGVSWLLIAVLSYGAFGCTSYTSPFVQKTEAELNEMEAQSAKANQYFRHHAYASAREELEALCREQTVSRPLYQLELLSVLLMEGKRDEAHALMTSVQQDIEMLFDRASEEKATSFWHGEQNKVFKGDTHERAIFYAFFAMSFIERGNYEDALRCVKNGLLADSSTADESWNSDFGLLHYLGYLAASYAGETGEAEEYKREYLETLRQQGQNLDLEGNLFSSLVSGNTLPNAFLVVWSGSPPSYYRGGPYHEVRQVVPGADYLTMLTVEAAGEKPVTAARRLGDVNFQATTRGGREMDTVLANKALLKSGFNASGNILIAAGVGAFTVMSFQSDAKIKAILAAAGAGCFLLGIGFHYAGNLVNSEADIRAWRNLPANLLIVPLHLPAGTQEVTLHGYCAWDEIFRDTCVIPVEPGRVTTVHHSIQSMTQQENLPVTTYVNEGINAASRLLTDKNWLKYEITE